MKNGGLILKKQSGNKNGLPLWFKLFALVLVGLVISRLLGMQVFVEISYDGLPFFASLTDVRIYFLPLFLILLYIMLT